MCGLSEDIIGLWKLYSGTSEDATAFNQLYDYCKIEINTKEGFKTRYQNQAKNEQFTQNGINQLAYYEECQKHIAETDYPQKRGLSEEVIKKFMIGFDPHYNKGTGGAIWQAMIIPTDPNSFVARNTDPNAEKKDRYRKQGANPIYHTKHLKKPLNPFSLLRGS